ncbi:hypothetical protein AB0M94_23010 [Streptomyces xanthochromogenes]|uniref:hypothetical protein n=1 Tax=Streptomyces xanthochromogenes TaxID=67384 RepID=UPI003421DEDC
MQRLLTHEALVFPDYGAFELYDADCDAHDDNSLIPNARAHVAASNGYEVRVACAQSLIKVRLYIETWTAKPPVPDGWDGHCDLQLELPTGQLVISEGTMGARDVMLTKGHCGVRISYRGRSEAKGIAEAQSLEADLSRHDGTEQYLLQLWPEAQNRLLA